MGSGGWCPSPRVAGARGLWNSPEERGTHRAHPINPIYAGSSHLAGQAHPSDLRGLIRGFKAKKLDKRWKKHPDPAGWVGAHGNHLQMSAHPSRMWERPLLLQNNPRKINILGAVSPPHRLPPAAPLAAPALAGIILFLLPGSLRGLLPGRFPHPSFSFAARGPWEEGMPVSIAMRLALIRALPWEN